MIDEYQKTRDFESEILDRFHETFEFYQYSEDIVIPFLLQVYGDMERHRDSLIKAGHTETNLSTYLNNTIHGIGHCIRWIVKQKHPRINDNIGTTARQLHEMAAEFLSWGTGYHMIAQEFVTWSRKIKTVVLDEANKTITFLNPAGYDYSKVYDKQGLYGEQMQAIYSSYPHDEMEAEFAEWLKDINFSKPPIANHIKWSRGRTSKSYPLLFSKMGEILFPELPETTELDGYNLEQLRKFYALFFLNFHFIRWVEAVLDSQTGNQQLSFGSNPLYLNKDEFIHLASTVTGLTPETSKAIITDLTFNPDNFHTSVSIQPFVLSSTGTYYILPNLFSQLEPSRMILGAINKSGKKKIYDTLINLIEKFNLNKLYTSVSTVVRWQCYLEKVIKSDGRQIHPDLILVDPDQKNVCVIDYKHFIGPITASEVDYKMIELSKGAIQVQNYIDIISKLNKIGITTTAGFKIHGVLITHKPLPVPVSYKIDISIVDMASFIHHTAYIHTKNQGLIELMQLIQPNEKRKKIFTAFEAEILVGDWKIIRSQHKVT